MIEFFQAGGWGMFLVLILGVVTLGTSVVFVLNPDERRMAMIRAFSVATMFSVVTAMASDFATVFYTVPQNPKFAESPDFAKIIFIGCGESLTPLIMGSAFLTLVWIVTGVGMRRLSHKLSDLASAALAG